MNKKYLQRWQILERMINQNIYDEISFGIYDWRTVSNILTFPIWLISFVCIFFLQIIVITKIHRMSFVMKKGRFCRCGNFNMKRRKSWMSPICASIHFIMTYLLCALVHVSESFFCFWNSPRMDLTWILLLLSNQLTLWSNHPKAMSVYSQSRIHHFRNT